MQRHVQSALRKLTRRTHRLALKTAGKARSNISVVRHVGRRSGQTCETPSCRQHDDSLLIALPYGGRSW